MSALLRAAARLRSGLSLWRRLGLRRGTAAVVRVTVGRARAPFRARRLRRRPLHASADEVCAALGNGADPAALRKRVLAALPAVSAFERKLTDLSPRERADLLARADALLAHRFDLLGSGEVELGPQIDWHRDFKSGRRWPLVHIFRVPVRLSGGADLMVPRQLSRFQHLPLLAAAGQVTGDPRYLAEIGCQLEHWIATNPVEFGVNWARTIDAAIRAVNWAATLALCAGSAGEEPWFDRTVGSLLLHGRFIRSHLARSFARNNWVAWHPSLQGGPDEQPGEELQLADANPIFRAERARIANGLPGFEVCGESGGPSRTRASLGSTSSRWQ